MKRLAIFAMLILAVIPFSLAQGLKFGDTELRVDYDDAYTYRLEDKDRIDFATGYGNGSRVNAEIFPGANLTFTVWVENTFTDNDDEINNVFVTVTVRDLDDGSDVEEDSLEYDLPGGEDERYDIIIPVPLEVDTGLYDVEMIAEGDGNNGTSFASELNFKIEVKKQSHDIRIIKAIISPGSATCGSTVKLTADIMNLGSNFENEIAVEFKSGALGINSYSKDISLESSNDAPEDEKIYTKTLDIDIPSFFKSGIYPVFVNLYWKNFVLFDQKIVDLNVKNCADAQDNNQNNGQDNDQSGQQDTVQNTTQNNNQNVQAQDNTSSVVSTTEGVASSTETGIIGSRMLIVTVLVGFVVAMIAILAVFMVLKTKK